MFLWQMTRIRALACDGGREAALEIVTDTPVQVKGKFRG